jgi:hypothetical protein
LRQSSSCRAMPRPEPSTSRLTWAQTPKH